MSESKFSIAQRAVRRRLKSLMEALLMTAKHAWKVAASSGDLSLVELYERDTVFIGGLPLSYGPIDYTGLWEALHENAYLLPRAAKNGHIEVVEKMLAIGVPRDGHFVNSRDKSGALTALHWAAWEGHLEIVNFLIRDGAEVNCKTRQTCDDGTCDGTARYGTTPLHLAAAHGQSAIVAALMSCAKVNVSSKDKHGATALHWAAANGHAKVVKSLIVRGAELNSKDKDGDTALHRAALNEHTRVVKALLAHSADVHVRDIFGDTALHFAAEKNRTDIAKMLWKAGADSNIENDRHETPLSLLPRRSRLAIEMRSSPGGGPSVASKQHAKFRIFLSHAGEDKETIARPLYHCLLEHGISVFLDVKSFHLGDDTPKVMDQAMKTAPVGVFILSPEFVAKKWCMRELLTFVRRYDLARSIGQTPPLLIPVFYRLNTRECHDPGIFRKYNLLFTRHGLFQRATEGTVPLKDISHALHIIATVWGIENDIAASNEDNMASTGDVFVQAIVEQILHRMSS